MNASFCFLDLYLTTFSTGVKSGNEHVLFDRILQKLGRVLQVQAGHDAVLVQAARVTTQLAKVTSTVSHRHLPGPPLAIAAEAIEPIAALYVIESEIRGRPPEERKQIRQARARRLLESLRVWLESLEKLSRKSYTTAAVRYTLGL